MPNICEIVSLKGKLLRFAPFPSVFHIGSCACKRSELVKKKGLSLHQQTLLSPTERSAPEMPHQ